MLIRSESSATFFNWPAPNFIHFSYCTPINDYQAAIRMQLGHLRAARAAKTGNRHFEQCTNLQIEKIDNDRVDR